RNADRKAVGVAEIDMTDRSIELAGHARIRGDEPREPLLEGLSRLVAAELEHEPVREPHLTGAARREGDPDRVGAERCHDLAKRAIAAGPLTPPTPRPPPRRGARRRAPPPPEAR